MSLQQKLHRALFTHPSTFAVRKHYVSARRLIGGPPPYQALLISDGEAYTSEEQFAPILRWASYLSDQAGLVLQHRELKAGLSMPASSLNEFDMIGLKLSFKTPEREAVAIVKDLKLRIADSPTKLVYFDGDDDLNVQWKEVISNVDLYVKKHTYIDSKEYLKRYIGKSNITDYVARTHGTSFDNDIIPSSEEVEASDVKKIHLGWNIALDDKIFNLSRRIKHSTQANRSIDISCRAYADPAVWIAPMRNAAVEKIESLSNRFRILAPKNRVNQDQYYEEMLSSKICVSPFGFGEICWRDFEAIICGCLLVKPSMDHAMTSPNLFIPGHTYIPVRWDYADLEDVCAKYLENDNKRIEIVERAREELNKALQPAWTLNAFKSLISATQA